MKKFYGKLHYKYIIIYFFALFLQAQNKDSVLVAKYPPNSFKVINALNFKDTDIRDVLRGIAINNETNISVDNRLNLKINIALYNLTVFDAVKLIALDNGCDFIYDETRFIVKTKEAPIQAPPPPLPDAIPIIGFNYLTNRINIESNNVNIDKFVDELRKATNKNFLLTKGTSGKISGMLKQINLTKGLKNILMNNGFVLNEKDSIFYISKSNSTITNKPGETPIKKYWVNAKSVNDINIDIVDANISDVLEDLITQLDLQIIFLAKITGVSSVRCYKQPLDKVLHYLFKSTEFTVKKENDTFIIGDKKNANMNSMKLYRLKHLRADLVNKQIPKNLFPGIYTDISTELNGIVISGNIETVFAVEDYLNLIDKPVPQVMIEALVVDYNLDNMSSFGISAGTGDSLATKRPNQWFPGFDVTLSGAKVNKLLNDIGSINLFGSNLNVAKLGNLPDDFYMNLKFLEENGVANVKSRPMLSSLNGHTASLKIGTTQNYVFKEIMPITSQMQSTYIERERVEKIEANISFEITPWVGPNGELTLEIKPDFQTPVGQFSPDKRIIPAINTRTFSSTVKLRDGETIILGGLIQETETSIKTKVPILGDIPLLGKLFTRTEEKKIKGELIIYLTPRVFYEDKFGYEDMNFSK